MKIKASPIPERESQSETMRKCPGCRTRRETREGNEAKTAFCTFFSLVLAGTWNRRGKSFPAGRAQRGGVGARRAAGVPSEQGSLCGSLLCPRGVCGPSGVPGTWAGAARPSQGWPGGDGGRKCPLLRRFPGRGEQEGECSEGGRGRVRRRSLRGTHGPLFPESAGRKFGWTRCVPPSQRCRRLIPG